MSAGWQPIATAPTGVHLRVRPNTFAVKCTDKSWRLSDGKKCYWTIPAPIEWFATKHLVKVNVNRPSSKDRRDKFARIARRDGNKCHYCGSIENLTLDHKKAFAKGGSNSIRNLLICCRKCNQDKGAMGYEEFIGIIRKRTERQVSRANKQC